MASTATVHPDVWGYIEQGTTAHDLSGTTSISAASQDGAYPGNIEFRAYWSFDTSTIPDGAKLTSGIFYGRIKRVTEPIGFSGLFLLAFWAQHNRIGASISLDDWGLSGVAGVKHLYYPSNPGLDVDFSITATDPSVFINKAGDTDVECRDVGAYTDPPGPLYWEFWTKEGATYRCWLEAAYALQGVLGKTPSGNIGFYGGMCLATLSKLLMAVGIIPPNSEIDRVNGSDIHVVTRFVPRTVMGACS